MLDFQHISSYITFCGRHGVQIKRASCLIYEKYVQGMRNAFQTFRVDKVDELYSVERLSFFLFKCKELICLQRN